MKIISTVIIWIFILSSYAFSQIGVVANYTLKGESFGQTKIRGKFRAVFAPGIKRITGFLYYQEAGKIFPASDDKDIIINYSQKLKNFYTRESRSWLSTSLEDEYAMISSKSIKVYSKKVNKTITTTVNLNLKTSLGGAQKYIITYTYESEKPDKVNDKLKQLKGLSSADILTLFINNEKTIDTIAKKSLINKYGFPDSFTIKWQQKGKTKLNVSANLKVKNIAMLPGDAFAYDQ